MAGQMVLIFWKFFELSPSVVIPPEMPWYYLVFLISMAVVRAGARWANRAMPKRYGDILVLIWTLYALTLYMISGFTGGRYQVPPAMFENFWIVVSVYAGSRAEKFIFAWIRARALGNDRRNTKLRA